MKLDFVLLDNGRYAAAFNPTEGGALEIIQEQGGELYVYAYVNGVNPILIDKDLTKKTAYLKMLDIKGVNIRVESTAPIREACYSGKASKVVIQTGKGEFGLMKLIMTGDITSGMPESSFEILEESYNLGDTVSVIMRQNDPTNVYFEQHFILITEDQYQKFTKVELRNVDSEYNFVYTPEDEDWTELFGLLENLKDEDDTTIDFGKYKYYVTALSIAEGAYNGGEVIVTYDGQDYVYNSENCIIEDIR